MTSPLTLTEAQSDILTETINIGFGRAAASLSVLIGRKVILEVPHISVLSIPELSSTLQGSYQQLIGVHQQFMGGIDGDVLLFMELDIAAMFIDLLSGGSGAPRRLTHSDREALLEVGNILLNAYIGSFGNLMNATINIAVPQLYLNGLQSVFNSIQASGEEHYVLLVRTRFLLNNGSVAGHVALILDTDSLESLIQRMQIIM